MGLRVRISAYIHCETKIQLKRTRLPEFLQLGKYIIRVTTFDRSTQVEKQALATKIPTITARNIVFSVIYSSFISKVILPYSELSCHLQYIFCFYRELRILIQRLNFRLHGESAWCIRFTEFYLFSLQTGIWFISLKTKIWVQQGYPWLTACSVW